LERFEKARVLERGGWQARFFSLDHSELVIIGDNWSELLGIVEKAEMLKPET
jgi:hypothetical protein